jgi:hypothetical protein
MRASSRRGGRSWRGHQAEQQRAGGAEEQAARRAGFAFQLRDPAVEPILADELGDAPVQVDVLVGKDDGAKAQVEADAEAKPLQPASVGLAKCVAVSAIR